MFQTSKSCELNKFEEKLLAVRRTVAFISGTNQIFMLRSKMAQNDEPSNGPILTLKGVLPLRRLPDRSCRCCKARHGGFSQATRPIPGQPWHISIFFPLSDEITRIGLSRRAESRRYRSRVRNPRRAPPPPSTFWRGSYFSHFISLLLQIFWSRSKLWEFVEFVVKCRINNVSSKFSFLRVFSQIFVTFCPLEWV